jgi:imidazoleglycerol phosphate synthase glutamine amidotransferase subunit HisH
MANIAVIDYDMGNLHSACKGLEKQLIGLGVKETLNG